MGKKYHDEQWLREQLNERGRTQKDIADDSGVTTAAVNYYVDKFDIDVQKEGEDTYRDEGWMREQYIEQGKSTVQIAQEIGSHHKTIQRWLGEHNIPTRSLSEASQLREDRDRHATVRIDKDGYRIAKCGKTNDRFPIHRLIAVAEYGIDAVSGNVVHHKNEFKIDNRPSNLEPMPLAEHTSLHHTE